jgi:hypothetical protein
MIIPIEPVPFQRFKVNIGILATVYIKWSTRYSYFSVDIYDGDTPITLGRALHPEMDLFAGLNLDLGRLYLSGNTPTVENLGIENQLTHEVL